jgi:hypothetical protein
LRRVVTTVTLLGLLVATSAAFAITEHLKLIKSALYGPEVSKYLSPVCDCSTRVARIQFRLRHPDRVTVTIVDADGNEVREIRSGVALPAKQKDHFLWDGTTDDGTRVPDGVYYPQIHLEHSRHTFQLANKIIVDTKSPTVRAKVARPLLFVGPGRSVAIRYAFSEPAHAVVYLDGRRIIVGRRSRPHFKVKWAGTLGGRPLRPGRYVLSVGAQDVAGNETPASEREDVTVVVRYVELTPERLTVRSGGRVKVRVKTSAKRYTWRLGHQHGARRARVLRLRAPTTPGTYRLVVTENGHATTATVRVHS